MRSLLFTGLLLMLLGGVGLIWKSAKSDRRPEPQAVPTSTATKPPPLPAAGALPKSNPPSESPSPPDAKPASPSPDPGRESKRRRDELVDALGGWERRKKLDFRPLSEFYNARPEISKALFEQYGLEESYDAIAAILDDFLKKLRQHDEAAAQEVYRMGKLTVYSIPQWDQADAEYQKFRDAVAAQLPPPQLGEFVADSIQRGLLIQSLMYDARRDRVIVIESVSSDPAKPNWFIHVGHPKTGQPLNFSEGFTSSSENFIQQLDNVGSASVGPASMPPYLKHLLD